MEGGAWKESGVALEGKTRVLERRGERGEEEQAGGEGLEGERGCQG